MKTQVNDRTTKLWLSAHDTEAWATKPGAAWPCSTLRGKRVFAEFDNTGLVDFTINGKHGPDVDHDGHEFNAMTEDFLTPECFWLREGDAGEYESADSIEDLDLEYRELGKFSHWVPLGFCTDLYGGHNYISLYKATTADQGPNHELGAAEKRLVERKLREALKGVPTV